MENVWNNFFVFELSHKLQKFKKVKFTANTQLPNNSFLNIKYKDRTTPTDKKNNSNIESFYYKSVKKNGVWCKFFGFWIITWKIIKN